jgi:hypothetical protein
MTTRAGWSYVSQTTGLPVDRIGSSLAGRHSAGIVWADPRHSRDAEHWDRALYCGCVVHPHNQGLRLAYEQ